MVHFKKWKKKKREKRQAQYGSMIGCNINMYRVRSNQVFLVVIPQEYVHFSICFLTVLPLQMPFCADYYFTVAKC